jgi:hypothetical protein
MHDKNMCSVRMKRKIAIKWWLTTHGNIGNSNASMTNLNKQAALLQAWTQGYSEFVIKFRLRISAKGELPGMLNQ